MEKADPDVATDQAAPHPLDTWLKRELQAFYGESDRDSLPVGIAELAAQLEEKLKGQGGGKAGGGSSRDETRKDERDGERIPRRDGKR